LTGENRWQHVWTAVHDQLRSVGYTVEVVTRSAVDSWNGRTDFAEGTVVVSDHLEPPQRLKTLLHEWAHIAMQHGAVAGPSRAVREVEAESVAYLIAGTIGLDSSAYTLPYVAGWSSGQVDLVAQTAQRVLAATGEMIATLEAALEVELTADPLATARNRDAEVVPLVPERRPEPRAAAIALHYGAAASNPDVVLDNAPGALRQVLTRLEPDDRAHLMGALTEVDTSLDIATGLLADAGLDARQTAEVLLRAGAEAGALYQSMRRVVVDAQGDLAPLFERAGTAIADTMTPTAEGAASAASKTSQPSTYAVSPAQAILDGWASVRPPVVAAGLDMS
jgi:hypothetical protein